MFIAREAGPELVGTIGSRNAVVNNDQIVESVSRGVYDAVTAAMTGGKAGTPLELNLHLDGRQITHTVERVQRERGLSLLGGMGGSCLTPDQILQNSRNFYLCGSGVSLHRQH